MTTNHDYNTPEQGTTDWHIPLNENFQAIDTDTEVRDVSDNLSNYSPKDRAKFLAIDTGEVYVGDGSSWNYLGDIVPEQVGDGGGGGGEYVDVRNFGADPDASDNTAAIQSAIDAADPANGGPGSVLIPEFYEVNPGSLPVFVVPSGMEIRGLGPSTGVHCTYSTTQEGNNQAIFRVDNFDTNGETVRFRDFFIRGNQTDGASSTSDQNSSQTSIAASNDANQNLTVDNMLFLDGRTGIGFKGRGAVNVSNCTFLNVSRAAGVDGAREVNFHNIHHKVWPVGNRDGWTYRTIRLGGPNRANVSNVTSYRLGDSSTGGTALLITSSVGPAVSPSEVNVTNCAFYAREGNDSAKGIFIQTGDSEMRNVNVSNVHCEGFENTITFWTKNGASAGRNITFENVTGQPHGAAIAASAGAPYHDVTFRNCRIEGAPIRINPQNDNDYENWVFDGGHYVAPNSSHTIGSNSVGDFTFDGVRLESGASTTLDIQGGPHGRFQFINCDIDGGSLDVSGADRLEVMMGRFPSVNVATSVGSGWIRNAELTTGSLLNGAGLVTDNVEGA